jgi:hypothetical protein
MLGISVSGLEKYNLGDYSLFKNTDKQSCLTKTICEINTRYGSDKIFIAGSLGNIEK